MKKLTSPWFHVINMLHHSKHTTKWLPAHNRILEIECWWLTVVLWSRLYLLKILCIKKGRKYTTDFERFFVISLSGFYFHFPCNCENSKLHKNFHWWNLVEYAFMDAVCWVQLWIITNQAKANFLYFVMVLYQSMETFQLLGHVLYHIYF